MKHRLNLSWVAPGLAVGGSFRPIQVEGLREFAIRRVVDVRAESCDDRDQLARHGIELLHLPTADLVPLDRSSLVRGVEWVCDGLERSDGVLIHCEHGIGRAASLACCVLMARGFSLTEAMELLVRARSRVSPSPAQIDALVEWAAERFGRRIRREELTAVLYRRPKAA
ncbi:MAG TPA: dual specificity protein phosphatase [Kofleriaceae bacterium]|nr:dual specificity protein phosphatase [Kofleriaceae bacterium]